MRMLEDRRAPASDVIDVLSAVGSHDARALRAADENRVSAHRAKRAHGTVDAARNETLGAIEQRAGDGVRHGRGR